MAYRQAVFINEEILDLKVIVIIEEKTGDKMESEKMKNKSDL